MKCELASARVRSILSAGRFCSSAGGRLGAIHSFAGVAF